MTHFILVHGACHGAWCWQELAEKLRAAGHEATALDMPGRGGDVAGLGLADHAATILGGYQGRAVLVGHSAGGFSISAAAEAAPDRVARLIYVAALIPRDGDSVGGVMGALKGDRATLGFRRAEDGLSYSFDTSGAGPVLYNGAPEQAMDWALERITFEPSDPHREAIQLGANHAGVAASAVICDQDRVIPAVDQDRMAAGIPDIARIDTGHSPFLSTPEVLADHLIRMGV